MFLALLLGSFAFLPPQDAAPAREDYSVPRGGLANARHVFESTRRGRVAFLGGSITHNPGWRELVCEELRRRFPGTEFEFVAAGIPSTGSTPGAFRLARDVLAAGPVDLLFEEAAVNDATNGRSDLEQVRGMEGIVRHARAAHPSIDIVLLHFVDPAKMAEYRAGRVPAAIANHERVAEHYALPSIDLAREVTERIDRGEFTWEGDFQNLHPSPFGQRVYARAVARLFDRVWPAGDRAAEPPGPRALPAPLDPFSYDAGELRPPDGATNLDGFELVASWRNTVGGGTRAGFVDVPMLVGERPGARFDYVFRGRAVGVFVAAGNDAGVIEYRVDGGAWRRQDLFTRWSAGLHLPWLHVLEAELRIGVDHRLEVRIAGEANSASRGHACRIAHFAINGQGRD